MAKKPPGWYKTLVTRPVVNVDGYERYEKICTNVAGIFFSVDERELRQQLITNIKDSKNITLYTLYKVGEAKCPAYWIGKELLTALMQSELTVEIDNLHWAMKTGIFMLPKGIVFSPTEGSISAICWHYDTTEKSLYWTANDKESFYCRKFVVSANSIKFSYTDVADYDPQAVKDFNGYLQAIFLRLILIMECRPELVEAETKVVNVSKGFSKNSERDLYEPLWIGRNYTIKRDTQDKGGVHASPRVHWRKGFLRNQPYGEGRQQRKLVWIEPVLVLGKSD